MLINRVIIYFFIFQELSCLIERLHPMEVYSGAVIITTIKFKY